jgi:hypothetical protein
MLLDSEWCLQTAGNCHNQQFPLRTLWANVQWACTKCLASVTVFWIGSALEIVTFYSERTDG